MGFFQWALLGIGIIINNYPSLIFRSIHCDCPTLIMDEVEGLKEADQNKDPDAGALIRLLNAGFRSGSRVGRSEVAGKSFKPVYFNAYSPKVLAGINPITSTIDDRSFYIKMDRKMQNEEVDRFNLRKKVGELKKLRESLYIWALRNAEDVEEFYSKIHSDGLKEIKNIDPGAKDICEPLLSIAAIIDAKNDGAGVYGKISEFCLEVGRARADKEETDSLIKPFIEIARGLIPDGEKEVIKTSRELFDMVQHDEVLKPSFNSMMDMSTFLRKFGLAPYLTRIPGRAKPGRAYRITTSWFEEIGRRYA